MGKEGGGGETQGETELGTPFLLFFFVFFLLPVVPVEMYRYQKQGGELMYAGEWLNFSFVYVFV